VLAGGRLAGSGILGQRTEEPDGIDPRMVEIAAVLDSQGCVDEIGRHRGEWHGDAPAVVDIVDLG
jgi:hypothetical protein